MARLGSFFLRLLSRLPLQVLYGLSGVLFVLLYSVIRYRRKVVVANLRSCFPGMPDSEIRAIARRYYRNLCDITVEAAKMISISRAELVRRTDFATHRVVDELNAQGRTCFCFTGHVGNWEWSTAVVGLAARVPVWAVYKVLSNRAMDELFLSWRSRFGCEMIPMEQIARRVLNDHAVKSVCFVADQTPANPNGNVWVPFFNRPTLFFGASAKLAARLDIPIVYAGVHRTGRGRYRYQFEPLIDHPAGMSAEEIMTRFAARLEQDIRQAPDNWLWSHRRWKHAAPLAGAEQKA